MASSWGTDIQQGQLRRDVGERKRENRRERKLQTGQHALVRDRVILETIKLIKFNVLYYHVFMALL